MDRYNLLTMKKDKVLITGANGFVGSSLAEYLENDFEVITFTRENDINEIIQIEPQYIVHCAAEVYNHNLMFESNVILTHKLLEIAKDLPSLKHFIYIGSSSEYGRKANPISEKDVLEPDSMYEGTKACGTMLTRVYGKTYGFMTAIVRPFSLYGINEPQRKFIPRLYESFKNDSSIAISPGVHDWTHINDFVNGIRTVMLNNTESGGYYHFGTGKQYSNYEVFQKFCILLNKTIEHSVVEENKGSAGIDSESWVADIAKVSDAFGWTPEYTLDRGLEEYIKYKQNEQSA